MHNNSARDTEFTAKKFTRLAPLNSPLSKVENVRALFDSLLWVPGRLYTATDPVGGSIVLKEKGWVLYLPFSQTLTVRQLSALPYRLLLSFAEKWRRLPLSHETRDYATTNTIRDPDALCRVDPENGFRNSVLMGSLRDEWIVAIKEIPGDASYYGHGLTIHARVGDALVKMPAGVVLEKSDTIGTGGLLKRFNALGHLIRQNPALGHETHLLSTAIRGILQIEKALGWELNPASWAITVIAALEKARKISESHHPNSVAYFSVVQAPEISEESVCIKWPTAKHRFTFPKKWSPQEFVAYVALRGMTTPPMQRKNTTNRTITDSLAR